MVRESHMWTGPKNGHELHRYLDNLLVDGRKNVSVAGRSGLQNFNTRRWTVMERTEVGERATCKPPVRFAVLIDFKVQGNWIDTDITDESEGFHEYDIPRRLLALLDGHPPVNESAGQVADEVRGAHERQAGGRKAAEAVEKHRPGDGGETPLAVGDLTAEFEMRQHRGRDRDTYRPLGQAHSYPLKPESVNVERTLELLRERDQAEARTQPEHSGGAEK